MHKKFEKLFSALKKVQLKNSEKATMRSVLEEYTEHLPEAVLAPHKIEKSWTSFLIESPFARRGIPVAIIILAVVFNIYGTPTPVAFDTVEQVVTKESDEFARGVDIDDIGVTNTNSGSAPSFDGASSDFAGLREEVLIYPDPYYPYPVPSTPDITDTREFIKLSYSATIQTRDVHDTVRNVEDVVRRVDGRIDHSSSGERWGRVSFVVSKSSFYAFKSDIESLTHKALIIEDTSSQNLLGQKQDIERRTDDVSEYLNGLEQEKKNLDASHAQRINTIKGQIAKTEQDLADIREQIVDETDPDEIEKLEAQEKVLVTKLTSLKRDEVNENNNYTAKSQSLATQIEWAKNNLEGVIKEDIAFDDNIETVSGHINVQWISLWDLGEVFSPTPMVLNVIVLALGLWWYWERRAKWLSTE